MFRFPIRSSCSYGDTELWVNFSCLNFKRFVSKTNILAKFLKYHYFWKPNILQNISTSFVSFKWNFRLWKLSLNISTSFILRAFQHNKTNSELNPLSRSSCWCRGWSGGNVEFCHCRRGRGGNTACWTQGSWYATTHASHSCGLAPALLLLAGHVDANLDSFSLLQSQVKFLWWLLFLLFNLFFNLKIISQRKKLSFAVFSPVIPWNNRGVLFADQSCQICPQIRVRETHSFLPPLFWWQNICEQQD